MPPSARRQGSQDLRRAAAGTMMDGGPGARAAQFKRFVNADPWAFYDTQLFAAAGVNVPLSNGVAGVFNFAQLTNPLAFFAGRSVSNSAGFGYPVTNMNDSNKMEYDFLADYICVEAWCDADAVGAASISAAGAFVESILMYTAIVLSFGPLIKYVVPVSHCPAGGGIFVPTKVAAGSATVMPTAATNGLPTWQAARRLKESIFFERGSVFSMQLQIDALTIARINAITALTGTFKAMVRVKLDGVRGLPLLEGTPRNA